MATERSGKEIDLSAGNLILTWSSGNLFVSRLLIINWQKMLAQACDVFLSIEQCMHLYRGHRKVKKENKSNNNKNL